MKPFDLAQKAHDSGGEYVYGARDTGSHACYMIYGILGPREAGREIRPGKGHEEIILALRGSLTVSGHFVGTLSEGSAMHLAGEETCFLENKGDAEAVYVIAGGHGEDGRHH